MSASIPEPHPEARIDLFFDPSRGWCAMWNGLAGQTLRRDLRGLEVELLFRPYPGLVRYPSYSYRDPEEWIVEDVLHEEDEYTMLIRVQLAPNMIAAIERLHVQLAEDFNPLTEDMGWEGMGRLRNEERRNSDRGRMRGEDEKETGDGG